MNRFIPSMSNIRPFIFLLLFFSDFSLFTFPITPSIFATFAIHPVCAKQSISSDMKNLLSFTGPAIPMTAEWWFFLSCFSLLIFTWVTDGFSFITIKRQSSLLKNRGLCLSLLIPTTNRRIGSAGFFVAGISFPHSLSIT